MTADLVKFTLTMTRLDTGETITLSAGRVRDATVNIENDLDTDLFHDWWYLPTVLSSGSSHVQFTGEMLSDGDCIYTITRNEATS